MSLSVAPSRPTPAAALALFAVLAGAAATFGLGYSYGLGNHIELLPHVERLLDPAFAQGDVSVDASAGGPRHYFARLCALAAGILPLPIVFLLLTLIQNAGIALLTAFAARRLFPGRDAAPCLAVILALTAAGPRLGEAGYLALPTAVAFSAATPLALAALWLGLIGRPGASLAAAVPALLIHPLVGLEVASLGLSASFLEGIWTALRRRREGQARDRQPTGAAASLLAMMVLLSLAGLLWIRHDPWRLPADEFIGIYARFRAPHHLWPASFPPGDWLVAGAFFAAAALAGLAWRRSRREARLFARIGVVLALIPAAALAGWLFVQVVPIRTVVTLQLFRLTLVLKWLGYLLLAGAAAELVAARGGRTSRRWPFLLAGLGIIAGLAASLGRIGEADLPGRQHGLALAGVSLIAAAWLGTEGRIARGLAAAAAAAVFIGAVVLPAGGRLPVVGRLLDRTRPVFTLEQGNQREDGAARFCRETLPRGSVIVTPPLLGRVRLVSRRALPADFKFMPTSDPAMAEWRRRLEDAYGPVAGVGFAAAREMDRAYRAGSEERLALLRRKYGVGYALLYAETPSRARELYRDRWFKVVEIAAE